MSDELSQERTRQLRMMVHACLDQLGGNRVLIDADDNPSACRLAPAGDRLVLAEFAADQGKSRFRQLEISLWSSCSIRGTVWLPSSRNSLACRRIGNLQIDRPPEPWFGHVTVLLLEALQAFLPAA